MTFFLVAIATLGVLGLALHFLGTLVSSKFFSDSPISGDTPYRLIPVTILKPLKGNDAGLRDNLISFFRLDYPEFELIFSVADPRDSAARVAQDLILEFPWVKSRLIQGDADVGPNPKVNNLIRGYESAKHDWVLISDSNVRVERGYLKRMVSQITSDTGMITSVVRGTSGEGIGGLLEETFLNTYYARGMMIASAAGKPCVVGKSMLFRRSVAERFGGLRVLGQYLAEDYMAGEAMRHLGLKVAPAWDPVPQHIGAHRFQDFWSRHVRWGRIRRVQAPIVFAIEPLSYPVISTLMLAWGSAGLMPGSASFGEMFLVAISLFALSDVAMMRAAGARLRPLSLLVWLLREMLALPLWIMIASGKTVFWRGQRYRLGLGGLVHPIAAKIT